MGAEEFGAYFEQQTRGRGLTLAQIGWRIGEWPAGAERILNETGVRRIFEGKRRLDREFIAHLIATFGLDEVEAWQTAGLWPAGLDQLGLRRLRALASDESLRKLVDKRLAAGGSGNPVCIIPRTGQRIALALVA